MQWFYIFYNKASIVIKIWIIDYLPNKTEFLYMILIFDKV